MPYVLLGVAIFGLITSTVFAGIVLWAVPGFLRERRAALAALAARPGFVPPLSLFKPLNGTEPGLEPQLESFFQQDYPSFEILFCARSSEDAGLAAARRIAARHPEVPVKFLATGGQPDYINDKVISMEKMAALKPLKEGGTITAAVSSQTCDAASVMLIVSAKALKRYQLTPRARIHHISVLGDDPIWMLTAPIAATRHALKKAGMRLDDIDLVEINEAFAPVVMAWLQEIGYPHAQTNVNGGAIALGHPLGATGTKLMTTLLNELERRQGRFGLQTMCEGGGQANVTIIERL